MKTKCTSSEIILRNLIKSQKEDKETAEQGPPHVVLMPRLLSLYPGQASLASLRAAGPFLLDKRSEIEGPSIYR